MSIEQRQPQQDRPARVEGPQQEERPEAVGKHRRMVSRPGAGNRHFPLVLSSAGVMPPGRFSIGRAGSVARRDLRQQRLERLLALPVCLTALACSRLTGLPTTISATIPIP